METTAAASPQLGFATKYVAESSEIRKAAFRLRTAILKATSSRFAALLLKEMSVSSTPRDRTKGRMTDKKGFGLRIHASTHGTSND